MSDLAAEYQRQFGWRDWGAILAALPPLRGKTVLDLGCGAGDMSSELAAQGAHVLGFDSNEELLAYARSREIPNTRFGAADLRTDVDFGLTADGIWCSFTAAFLIDLQSAVTRWARALKPGGWIALTEIDDLFGHEPLASATKARLNAYCEAGLAAGRYDFWSGRKLSSHLERAGFSISKCQTVRDRELSFDGPAEAEVLEAWRARFLRMRLLQDYLAADFTSVVDEFLGCLGRADHRSEARVFFCLATKPPTSTIGNGAAFTNPR
jgi:SAM-dependent methyltransferase